MLLISDSALAAALEEALIGAGVAVVRTRLRDSHLWRSLERVGVFTLVDVPEQDAKVGAQLAIFSVGMADPRLEPLLSFAPDEPGQRLTAVVTALRRKGILPAKRKSKAPEEKGEAAAMTNESFPRPLPPL